MVKLQPNSHKLICEDHLGELLPKDVIVGIAKSLLSIAIAEAALDVATTCLRHQIA
jgi:hypothetical protein